MPGMLVAGVVTDCLYLVKTNILQEDDLLYHFPMTIIKFAADDLNYTYQISAHSDTEIHFQVDNRNYDGTFEVSIENMHHLQT
jgi:hypothetical protein